MLAPTTIACYLAHHGWQRHASAAPHLSSWQYRSAGILLPTRNDSPDRDRLVAHAVRVLAWVENRPEPIVRQGISTAIAL